MPQPYQVFTIYAREDALYLEELRGQLRPLENAGRIKVWSDREINPGADWEKTIVHKLDTADIILILVSSAYFNSAYIHEVEIKYALKRHEAGEARVLPIIVRPCAFGDDPVISRLQALPTDGKPVTDHRYWPERDIAWLDVVTGLKKTLDLLQGAEEGRKQAALAALQQEQAEADRRIRAAEQAEADRQKAEKRSQDAAKRRAREAEAKAAEAKRAEAEQAAETASWQQASKTNTIEAYERYRNSYPRSARAREAQERIKALKKAAAPAMPLGKYAAIGGGALALVLAIWAISGLFSGGNQGAIDPAQFAAVDTMAMAVPNAPKAGDSTKLGLRPLNRSILPKNVTVGQLIENDKKKKETTSKTESQSGGGAGTGDFSASIGGELAYRKVIYKVKATNESNKSGRVVIKVCVDASGRVTKAAFSMAGSTTTDSELKNNAMYAAKAYRFAQSKVAEQCGDLNFIFGY